MATAYLGIWRELAVAIACKRAIKQQRMRVFLAVNAENTILTS
jgi:hypothetical protein